MRAIVACGWFGIQAWIGGEALNMFFGAIIPGWNTLLGGPIGGHTPTEWLSFLLFWGFNIYIIYRGMDLLRKVENWAAPFVLVMTALLLGWALWKADGLGYLLNQQGKFHTFGEFWPIFIPSLTGMIGFWATLSLNMPDFTRFGKSQREQVDGPGGGAADDDDGLRGDGRDDHFGGGRDLSAHETGRAVGSDETGRPVSKRAVIAISMFTVVVATLAVNIAANVVSPANDFANAFPKWISFRTGGLITGHHRHPDAAVAAARRSFGLHFRVAGGLLRRLGFDRRRVDRRLLAGAQEAAAAWRSVSHRKALTLTAAVGTGAPSWPH